MQRLLGLLLLSVHESQGSSRRRRLFLLCAPLLSSLFTPQDDGLWSQISEEIFTYDLDDPTASKINDHSGAQFNHELERQRTVSAH